MVYVLIVYDVSYTKVVFSLCSGFFSGHCGLHGYENQGVQASP